MNVEKRVPVKNGQIVFIHNDKCFPTSISIIYGICDENGKLLKVLELDMCEEFVLYGYTLNKSGWDKKNIEFIIDENNPMYKHFIDFLGKDKIFVLDDDRTEKFRERTMSIVNFKNQIIIRFNNNTHEDTKDLNKFSVSVKNVPYERKSKLDKNLKFDVKIRLLNLFNSLDKEFLENEIDR